MEQAQSLRDIMNKRRDGRVQVITVTSAKGGVGKSSVAVNMAIALSKRGRRVLLVDMDLGLANVDLLLGVRTNYSLADLLHGNMLITDIIEQSESGVMFISGGSGLYELINMPSQQLHGLISGLLSIRDVADTIIFDTPSGITEHITRLICASHVTWLVTTPEPTAMMDAYAMVKQVNAACANPNIQLILNKAESEQEANAALAGFIQISAKYTEVRISRLGYISRDQHMVTSVKRQVPLLIGYPRCAAAQGIENLADKFLMGASAQKTGLAAFLEKMLGKATHG